MSPASEYGDEPICPYCGHVHKDTGEWSDDFAIGSTAECVKCEREFRAVRNVSVSWRTMPMQDDPKYTALMDHLAHARDWRCECGRRGNAASSSWRWNGLQWEHHHGYPIGHVLATHAPEATP